MEGVFLYRVKMVRDGRSVLAPRTVASSPRAVWRTLRGPNSPFVKYADRETFLSVLLSARNEVIGLNVISMGSLTASVVHPREVFKAALIMGASAIVVAHNHPSGDPEPSREDREVTRALHEAGELLDVPLHDHVICCESGFYSFRDQGLL
jgi:DNA repair protein RadC